MYCVGRREGKECRLVGSFLSSPDERLGLHCIMGRSLTELLILVEDGAGMPRALPISRYG